MAMGECLAYSSLLKRSSLQPGLPVHSHLALTAFHSEDPSELS